MYEAKNNIQLEATEVKKAKGSVSLLAAGILLSISVLTLVFAISITML